MSFLLNLGDIGTFFSDELINLENFVNFISSDFVNFFQTIATDTENSLHTIAQFLTDIPSFLQNAISDIVSILQTFISGIAPTLENIGKFIANGFLNFLSDLANFGQTIASGIYEIVKDIGQAFAQFSQTIVLDFFNYIFPNFKYIASAGQQLLNFISPYLLPYVISKGLPLMIEKISELLPEFEIDLAPIGFGVKLPVKFGEFLEAFGENLVDFLKEVHTEIFSTFKDSLKEPFISDFKIELREIFNAIGLGDVPFADPRFTDVAKWVSVRSFDEVKDHLKETILLTGFPKWFTDAYLESPVDDYIPRNPLFRPVGIADVITGVQLGVLESSAISKYAYNNLITPKIANLMYKNSTARLLQRAIEQGIRQFVISPEEAYNELFNNLSLTGKDLYLKIYNLEYNYAVQRIVRQFLRSLLSRALSNFGRPYFDLKELEGTIHTLFIQLGYPKSVQNVFNTMVEQSQQIQFNQLLFTQLENLVRLGVYNKTNVDKILKTYHFDLTITDLIFSYQLQHLQLQNQLKIIQSQLKSFLIKPDDAEKELKKLGFDSSIIQDTIYENYTETLIKYQSTQIENLIRRGYYDKNLAEQQLKNIGVIKDFADIVVNYATTELEIQENLRQIQFQLQNFLLSQTDAINKLKALHINEALISSLILQYYTEPITKFKISRLESLARSGINVQKDLKAIGLTDEFISLFTTYTNLEVETKYHIELVQLALENYLMNDKTAISQLSKLSLDPVYQQSIIYRYYNVNLIKLILRNIEENLKELEITPQQALQELKKIGIVDEFANLLVELYTPTFYNIRTIAQYIIEGQLYKVGKVPINFGNAEQELKKLGIPDNQIQILLNQYALQFGLETWRKYLPSLSEIQTAIRYNYPISKLVDLSFIPSELLNLHLDLIQFEQIAQQVQGMRSLYISLQEFNYNYPQLEQLLTKYGINQQLLQVLQMEAKIRKIITGLQELYLTPSKALTISEYVSNPDQLLQKVFSEYSIPTDLQNTYLEYARNRRLRTYINQIISTISLLFEKGKIDLGTAQSYLQQLKQYGLTNEEVQLIILNWQLRSLYQG
ncbi:hypothetical protein SBRV1_gp36 [Sulfolobales Beppu rod-shaped virus 1]|uniref:Uncharacterized protein n=1 Tax=Sulfolobales Beppu rod-shaped virus 1 TaxID=2493121 RepID=A0A3S8NFB2_9VIRU|nr:hypothetical protein QIT32_gp36 [Sulfolobales Beppu rod-shaped virus 1]AZI75925.1 hypothetical protein SBRV1_gp36 [Sulfolobales Beppu rod-shaped virus 1]